jgi:hypothetical protein
MEVDTDIVTENEDMENEKEESQEEKEMKSVELSIWRTSKSHGYNGLPRMYHSNYCSLFN